MSTRLGRRNWIKSSGDKDMVDVARCVKETNDFRKDEGQHCAVGQGLVVNGIEDIGKLVSIFGMRARDNAYSEIFMNG